MKKENLIENKDVDMDFKEMFTGLFNTDLLEQKEIETICKCGELYANAKNKKFIKALEKIEQMSDPGSYEKAITEMKSIATDALKN